MKRLWVFIFGLMWIHCLFFGKDASAENLSQELMSANAFYQKGEYSKALQRYEKLIEAAPHESVLFFNLGNTYFRLKKIGPAILAYERALQISPRDADILYNLNYIRGLLEYRIKDQRNWYLKAADCVLRKITYSETLFIMLCAYFLFILSWFFVLVFRRGLAWGWLRKFFLVACLGSVTMFVGKQMQYNIYQDAIVMDRESEVRFGPSDTDQIAFRLGEGLKVFVIEKKDEWSRIWLVNGESGWIRNRQIALVKTGIKS